MYRVATPFGAVFGLPDEVLHELVDWHVMTCHGPIDAYLLLRVAGPSAVDLCIKRVPHDQIAGFAWKRYAASAEGEQFSAGRRLFTAGDVRARDDVNPTAILTAIRLQVHSALEERRSSNREICRAETGVDVPWRLGVDPNAEVRHENKARPDPRLDRADDSRLDRNPPQEMLRKELRRKQLAAPALARERQASVPENPHDVVAQDALLNVKPLLRQCHRIPLWLGFHGRSSCISAVVSRSTPPKHPLLAADIPPRDEPALLPAVASQGIQNIRKIAEHCPRVAGESDDVVVDDRIPHMT